MINQSLKPIDILLVEDNEGDVFLTKKAFERAKITNRICVVPDGEEALDMLHKRGKYIDAHTPDLILLDINLPRKDGKQVLEEIKKSPDLRRIPVVILSSSKAEQDVLRTYDLHASSYIVKPISLDKFKDVVTAIENFWFSIVVLPYHD